MDGDFTLSLIMRVWLEKVRGEYHGACFPFREGFDSAIAAGLTGHAIVWLAAAGLDRQDAV